MKVSLNYGHTSMALDLPDENYLGTLTPKDIREIEDPINEVRRALANPIGSKKLKELVSSQDKVNILASDVSRLCPSYSLLPPILNELNEAGLSNDQITIVFGLGVHRKQTEEKKKKIVGIGEEEEENMFKKIAILGANHWGYAMSAELSQVGYEVNLYEHPDVADNLKPIIEKGGINLIAHTPAGEPLELPAGGKTGFVKITGKVTSDMKEATEGVDLIMLVGPSHIRESFIRLLAPHVEDGQTIVVWPAYFGALLVAKVLKDMGVEKDVTICETESLIYTCNKTGPAQIFVRGKKEKLSLGVLPASRTEETIEHLKKIFPQFVPAQNVLETTFANGNPSIHPQSALLNMYRVERKFYPYSEVMGGSFYSSYDVTPGMARVMEAVDREKIALGEKFGLKIPTMRDTLKAFYGATGKDLYEALLNCYAYQIQMPPTSLQHRYIAEDVPFGLVPFASLGDQLGVSVPTIKGMVAIACAATDNDYWSKGLTIEKLGLAGKTAEEIIEYVNTGS